MFWFPINFPKLIESDVCGSEIFCMLGIWFVLCNGVALPYHSMPYYKAFDFNSQTSFLTTCMCLYHRTTFQMNWVWQSINVQMIGWHPSTSSYFAHRFFLMLFYIWSDTIIVTHTHTRHTYEYHAWNMKWCNNSNDLTSEHEKHKFSPNCNFE